LIESIYNQIDICVKKNSFLRFLYEFIVVKIVKIISCQEIPLFNYFINDFILAINDFDVIILLISMFGMMRT
jgi:hypothetical protein